MQSLVIQSPEVESRRPSLAAEVAEFERTLAERKRELTSLQEELRQFKVRYAQVVGSRLAELAEMERQIKEAEVRRLGLEAVTESGLHDEEDEPSALPVPKALRQLFWSVAKMFHPDHAADEEEARRRHSIMAEANRAYKDGDAESLNTLLDDTEFRSFCTRVRSDEDEHDFSAQLIKLKEELLTIDFGLRRIHQDSLYRLKIETEREAALGRDALAANADRIRRQIVKARHRLAHMS